MNIATLLAEAIQMLYRPIVVSQMGYLKTQ